MLPAIENNALWNFQRQKRRVTMKYLLTKRLNIVFLIRFHNYTVCLLGNNLLKTLYSLNMISIFSMVLTTPKIALFG